MLFSKRKCVLGTLVGVLFVVSLYPVILSKMALPSSREAEAPEQKRSPRAAQHQAGLKNGMREHEPGADTLGGKCSPWYAECHVQ